MAKNVNRNLEVFDMRLGAQDGSLINRHAYFDESVFERELGAIFNPSWQFVGHESEISQPGEYVTRKIMRDEVIVARSENGEIHVMLNSCRHRGVKLCSADGGKATNFQCAYHGWTYATDGRLRGVPESPTLHPSGIDRSKLGLHKARVEVFNGLIFATFNNDAAPLLDVFGDMSWYLDTVFKKTEYEAYGPPVRFIGDFNWKSGAENWCGDPYHGDVTHHTGYVAGVSYLDDMQKHVTDMQAMGAVVTNEQDASGETVFVFTADGGHAGLHFRIPAEFDRPVFPGLEKHLWTEIEQNASPDLVAGADRRIVCVSTTFPNFSVVEQLITNVGDDEFPAVSVVNVRVWLPLSATQTEVWSWLIVPKRATPAWKRASQRAFARTFNVGGVFEVDDSHNWNTTAQANRGSVGMALDNNYTALPEEPTPSSVFRGKVYRGPLHDVNFRSLYSTWVERMEAKPEPVTLVGFKTEGACEL
ncbi:aromatic ring-hydroxylating oxygenase subunit alpha [Pseudomonas sp. H11T01]|uniref:aromatic ring-hydroxylating oxygenase subunit alpha n=1 Tax=Pseudomonas sp. H11T01 TaxID=3402749 RepID=UPI003ABF0974